MPFLFSVLQTKPLQSFSMEDLTIKAAVLCFFLIDHNAQKNWLMEKKQNKFFYFWGYAYIRLARNISLWFGDATSQDYYLRRAAEKYRFGLTHTPSGAPLKGNAAKLLSW
jgi:hypothetical protein